MDDGGMTLPCYDLGGEIFRMGDIVRMERHGKFIGWYVRYKDTDGRRKMRASHQPTQALARRYLLEIEGRVARGRIGIPEPAPPVPTVAELAERFLCEYTRPRIKDLNKYRATARTALRRVLPQLGALPIDQVTASAVQRLRDRLLQGYAKNSARVALAHLGTLFNWAVAGGVLAQSPLRALELPRRSELVEYLSQAEVTALLAAADRRAGAGGPADRMLCTCLRFALHTGLRKGELFGLRWVDLDLRAMRLMVARSFRSAPKSGTVRHLRVPDALQERMLLWERECPKTPEGLVFPVITGAKSQPRMARAHERLGLAELFTEAGCRPRLRPWHALRHSFASHFMMQGGSILTLQKILGHSDIKMTVVYAHLAPDFLGEEMNRIKF
jgi:integrase